MRGREDAQDNKTCQYLHFCTSNASNLSTSWTITASRGAEKTRETIQHLYFCTSNASVLARVYRLHKNGVMRGRKDARDNQPSHTDAEHRMPLLERVHPLGQQAHRARRPVARRANLIERIGRWYAAHRRQVQVAAGGVLLVVGAVRPSKYTGEPLLSGFINSRRVRVQLS